MIDFQITHQDKGNVLERLKSQKIEDFLYQLKLTRNDFVVREVNTGRLVKGTAEEKFNFSIFEEYSLRIETYR